MQGLSDAVLKPTLLRLLRLLINQKAKPFLNDEIDDENIASVIDAEGVGVVFSDLSLRASSINEKLKDTELRLESGEIASLTVKMPWRFFRQRTVVTIKGLTLRLRPADEALSESADVVGQAAVELEQEAAQSWFHRFVTAMLPASDLELPVEGGNMHQWFATITKLLQVRIEDTSITAALGAEEPGSMRVAISQIDYKSTLVSGQGAQDAMNVWQIITFEKVRVLLLEAQKGSAQPQEHLLLADEGGAHQISIVMSDPKVTRVIVALQALHVRASPSQLHHLADLLAVWRERNDQHSQPQSPMQAPVVATGRNFEGDLARAMHRAAVDQKRTGVQGDFSVDELEFTDAVQEIMAQELSADTMSHLAQDLNESCIYHSIHRHDFDPAASSAGGASGFPFAPPPSYTRSSSLGVASEVDSVDLFDRASLSSNITDAHNEEDDDLGDDFGDNGDMEQLLASCVIANCDELFMSCADLSSSVTDLSSSVTSSVDVPISEGEFEVGPDGQIMPGRAQQQSQLQQQPPPPPSPPPPLQASPERTLPQSQLLPQQQQPPSDGNKPLKVLGRVAKVVLEVLAEDGAGNLGDAAFTWTMSADLSGSADGDRSQGTIHFHTWELFHAPDSSSSADQDFFTPTLTFLGRMTQQFDLSVSTSAAAASIASFSTGGQNNVVSVTVSRYHSRRQQCVEVSIAPVRVVSPSPPILDIAKAFSEGALRFRPTTQFFKTSWEIRCPKLELSGVAEGPWKGHHELSGVVASVKNGDVRLEVDSAIGSVDTGGGNSAGRKLVFLLGKQTAADSSSASEGDKGAPDGDAQNVSGASADLGSMAARPSVPVFCASNGSSGLQDSQTLLALDLPLPRPQPQQPQPQLQRIRQWRLRRQQEMQRLMLSRRYAADDTACADFGAGATTGPLVDLWSVFFQEQRPLQRSSPCSGDDSAAASSAHTSPVSASALFPYPGSVASQWRSIGFSGPDVCAELDPCHRCLALRHLLHAGRNLRQRSMIAAMVGTRDSGDVGGEGLGGGGAFPLALISCRLTRCVATAFGIGEQATGGGGSASGRPGMSMGKATGGMDPATFRAFRRRKEEQETKAKPGALGRSPSIMSDDDWCEVDDADFVSDFGDELGTAASPKVGTVSPPGASSGLGKGGIGAIEGAGGSSDSPTANGASGEAELAVQMTDEAQADCKLHWILLMRAYWLWRNAPGPHPPQPPPAAASAAGATPASGRSRHTRQVVQQIMRRVVAMMLRVLSKGAVKTTAEFQLHCLGDTDVVRSNPAGYLQYLLSISSPV
jgi:hypothetical protein